MGFPFNSGAEMQVGTDQLVVASLSGTTASTSAAVDRIPAGGGGGLSGKFFAKANAPSGTPTSFTVTCILQSSGTTDATDSNWTTHATLTLTGTATAGDFDSVNFNANGFGQHTRVRATPAFTGGTSPAALVAVGYVLGGLSEVP